MKRKLGQSALEIMVLIAIVAAALICMQSYLKRAIQGNVRNYADQVGGENFYSPGLTTSNKIIETTSHEETTVESTATEGMSITTTTQDITTIVSGVEEIGPLADEPGFE